MQTIDGHSSWVHSVTFSPDGTQIVSGSNDNTLRLWNAVSGAHLNTLKGHSKWVRSVAFSPDGTQIVSGSADNTLRLWDGVSGAHLKTLKGHSDWVHSVAFSPDGTQIVSGSLDNTLRLWDAVSGTHLNVLEGHSNPVLFIKFSLDGTQIISRSNNQLGLWDTVTGNKIKIYNTFTSFIQGSHLIQKNWTSFYPFISDDGWVWSINPKQRLCWIPPSYRPSNVNCLATNGTFIALGSNDRRVIILNLSGKPFI